MPTERGIYLQKITWHARLFLAASILCSAVFAIALILTPPNWKPHAILALPAGLIAAFLFGAMSKKMKAARLIIENRILHIQPAVLSEREGMKESETKPCETVEMFVSCFGILLGSKIIKFNQEGIQLKAVEIGRDYISIDYGTNANISNIRLLYARPDSAVLADIVEKFRYETGVVPAITE